MPRYIVETNFFVEAEDSTQAERLIKKALEDGRDNRLNDWTVAWCERDTNYPATVGVRTEAEMDELDRGGSL